MMGWRDEDFVCDLLSRFLFLIGYIWFDSVCVLDWRLVFVWVLDCDGEFGIDVGGVVKLLLKLLLFWVLIGGLLFVVGRLFDWIIFVFMVMLFVICWDLGFW